MEELQHVRNLHEQAEAAFAIVVVQEDLYAIVDNGHVLPSRNALPESKPEGWHGGFDQGSS